MIKQMPKISTPVNDRLTMRRATHEIVELQLQHETWIGIYHVAFGFYLIKRAFAR